MKPSNRPRKITAAKWARELSRPAVRRGADGGTEGARTGQPGDEPAPGGERQGLGKLAGGGVTECACLSGARERDERTGR